MAGMIEPMIGEIRQEGATTRRVLGRVPGDQLRWKPCSTARSLGQLALHVASIPGNLTRLASVDEFDASKADFAGPEPADAQEILSTLESGLKEAENYLQTVSDAAATSTWRLSANGKELIAIPRIALIRSIMLNHWYHHRGQLSVYLRMLNVKVPVIYGPSADESPFA